MFDSFICKVSVVLNGEPSYVEEHCMLLLTASTLAKEDGN